VSVIFHYETKLKGGIVQEGVCPTKNGRGIVHEAGEICPAGKHPREEMSWIRVYCKTTALLVTQHPHLPFPGSNNGTVNVPAPLKRYHTCIANEIITPNCLGQLALVRPRSINRGGLIMLRCQRFGPSTRPLLTCITATASVGENH
jgi:hypothetical protein